MPYSFHFVDDGRGMVQVGEGVITTDEVLDVIRSLNGLPEAVRQLKFALVDFTSAVELLMTGEELRDVVAENEITSGLISPGLIAIVAPKDQIYGLSRMWQVFVGRLNWRVEIFRTKSDAVDWLRHSVPELELAPQLAASAN